jgi:hypothetical protein
MVDEYWATIKKDLKGEAIKEFVPQPEASFIKEEQIDTTIGREILVKLRTEWRRQSEAEQ